MHNLLKVYHILVLCQGTGSYPNFPPGLQREILFIAKIVPRIAPCFSIACLAYSLHVGINLHVALPPIIGEIAHWYTRIRTIDVF